MFRLFFIRFIRLYQIIISPLFPQNCRFDISCSSNMIICVSSYGLLVGFYFGLLQIFGCSFWFSNHKGGFNG